MASNSLQPGISASGAKLLQDQSKNGTHLCLNSYCHGKRAFPGKHETLQDDASSKVIGSTAVPFFAAP